VKVSTQIELEAPASENDKIPQIRGVLDSRYLPDADFGALWDAIVVEAEVKERLLTQAILNFTVRTKVERAKLPLHGLLLMVGPPGTGKTSLARGLASKTAEVLAESGRFKYLEVDPHNLSDPALGRSQQAVQQFFGKTIVEQASREPTIVLLDEVETLAAARSKVSFEVNPIDVHRATDALLSQLDHLAARIPQLLFIATSNFPEAIDEAFLSRTDFTATIDRPPPEVCTAIFFDTVNALADHFPAVRSLLEHQEIKHAASLCRGLDGREIRKIVLSACTIRQETALDPNCLQAEDFLRAIQRANQERRKLDDYFRFGYNSK
jgi:SpoVK/Ycf46/Vps4 family AAA+-type ATPase